MDIPTSVATEISELRENFPQIKIQTATDDFLTGSYERTSYARVKFTLTFPSGYPDHPLIIDIASVFFKYYFYFVFNHTVQYNIITKGQGCTTWTQEKARKRFIKRFTTWTLSTNHISTEQTCTICGWE